MARICRLTYLHCILYVYCLMSICIMHQIVHITQSNRVQWGKEQGCVVNKSNIHRWIRVHITHYTLYTSYYILHNSRYTVHITYYTVHWRRTHFQWAPLWWNATWCESEHLTEAASVNHLIWLHSATISHWRFYNAFSSYLVHYCARREDHKCHFTSSTRLVYFSKMCVHITLVYP